MTQSDKPAPSQRERRQPSPQEQARLESIKRVWQQKRQVNERLSRIKHKIAVYSGKGGVGKTTIAVNLAAYIAQRGHSVGLLDVDIDCPNTTQVLGLSDRPQYQDGRLLPVESHGVKVLSMAFFQEREEEAIIWRGPMIHNAITQFLETTEWGELDYLVVDVPPGTSDAPLTVLQVLNMDGFIIVTTPQALAALDAKRSINMVRRMNVNVLGVVENFSGEVFGRGAGEQLAREMGLPFLGSLELRADYRDGSMPTVLKSDDVQREYAQIFERVETQLGALDRTKKR